MRKPIPFGYEQATMDKYKTVPKKTMFWDEESVAWRISTYCGLDISIIGRELVRNYIFPKVNNKVTILESGEIIQHD